MLFDDFYVKLYCTDCEENTEHVVKFQKLQRHIVSVKYYCCACYDLSARTGTQYVEWYKNMKFIDYVNLKTGKL